MISILLFLDTMAQNQWARRLYYNDRNCTKELALSIGVWLKGTTCPANTLPLNTVCETKSSTNPFSSEGTGCTPADTYVDSPYFPDPKVAQLVPNAPYLTINSYAPALNCPTDGSVPVEQNTFVADGKCYAVETQRSFFKATCSGNKAQLDICSDPACTSCGSGTLLSAGSFQSTSISFTDNTCNNALKMTCTTPEQIASGSSTTAGTTQTAGKSKGNSAIGLSSLTGLLLLLVQ